MTLERVVQNLLSNTIKYTPRNNDIIITVKAVNIAWLFLPFFGYITWKYRLNIRTIKHKNSPLLPQIHKKIVSSCRYMYFTTFYVEIQYARYTFFFGLRGRLSRSLKPLCKVLPCTCWVSLENLLLFVRGHIYFH